MEIILEDQSFPIHSKVFKRTSALSCQAFERMINTLFVAQVVWFGGLKVYDWHLRAFAPVLVSQSFRD